MTWPKNRGKRSMADDLRDRQHLTLTCGVDGCKHSWSGEFARVLRWRDRHRAKHHPEFAPARTQVVGFGENARREAVA